VLARSHEAILAAEDRETAFRRAFLGSGDQDRHAAAVYSGIGPLDPSELAGGFGALKGRLPFPLEGRTEIRRTKAPRSDDARLEMAANVGAGVRAVYGGRVAFADTYADYGRAIIVDHGDGYYTVSGNLGSIDVKVGDEVHAGDRIGTVGMGPRGAALYFEIRHGAKTANPASWFGI
jgi:septal ring factor EnvC (AmiA/AmiB activator)